MTLTSKERVKAAVAHEEPDRVPIYAGFVSKVARKLEEKYGNKEDDVGIVLGNDIVKTAVGFETNRNVSPDRQFMTPWGVEYRRVANEMDEYMEIVTHPLAGDESKLDSYRIPDPLEETQYAHAKKIVERYGKEKWIAGSCQMSIFESSWALRGLETLMMDMVLNEDYVDALMDKVMQFPLAAGKKMIDIGVDMIWLGDDVSTQRGMMMSLDMWRRFFRPRYERLIEEFKRSRKDIVVAYHCCGNCEMILQDMIDIGLDVLHSVQPLAMDPVEIKKKYGQHLTLFGGMDIQQLLPFGTPSEIRAEGKRLLEGCGKNGGYIFAPAHYIQADASVGNIEAFYKCGAELGSYLK